MTSPHCTAILSLPPLRAGSRSHMLWSGDPFSLTVRTGLAPVTLLLRWQLTASKPVSHQPPGNTFPTPQASP